VLTFAGTLKACKIETQNFSGKIFNSTKIVTALDKQIEKVIFESLLITYKVSNIF